MSKNLIFHQLFEHESSTYTYLLADPLSKEAVLIDPVLETVDRDLKLIGELGLKLTCVLDTHVHADHTTGAGELRSRVGCKTAVAAASGVNCMDLPLKDGQEVRFGDFTLRALATPGHTDSCMSFYCEGMVFTGDALLIRGTGRTDFQQGSSDRLYDSITQKLFTLPPETKIYPGHDYRGLTSSTIDTEMKHNPRVGGGRSKDEFRKIMAELKLAQPKKIQEAVPANLKCGVKSAVTGAPGTATGAMASAAGAATGAMTAAGAVLRPREIDGVPEVPPDEVHANLGKVLIIDVRRPDEFNNELGHVPGSELATLGEPLQQRLQGLARDKEIVFTCRSGARSATATLMAKEMGFTSVLNMTGGMILWNQLQLQVERS